MGVLLELFLFFVERLKMNEEGDEGRGLLLVEEIASRLEALLELFEEEFDRRGGGLLKIGVVLIGLGDSLCENVEQEALFCDPRGKRRELLVNLGDAMIKFLGALQGIKGDGHQEEGDDGEGQEDPALEREFQDGLHGSDEQLGFEYASFWFPWGSFFKGRI